MNLPAIPQKLIAYRLSNITHTGLHDKHFVRIKHVRSGKTLLNKFNFLFFSKTSVNPLMGDLFIEVFEEGWASNKNIARINFHTFFIHPTLSVSVHTLSKNPIELTLKG